ncbi:putative nuclease HARBI1 [Blattella germanica]|nr:putative nuclease HARBI1 [Blattella germanica]
MSTSKFQLHQIAKFPKVIGAIDCTHIRLQSPGGNTAEQYHNRKGYFSLNVQVVADAKLKIINVVVRWPGSTHDATIFNNSRPRAQFETGTYGDSLLLGDSGYGIKPYLMTPLLAPVTPAEVLYNESQICTRNVVERLFGVWKRGFPIFSLGMRMKLRTARLIIVASAVLHNIARERNDPEPEFVYIDDEVPVENDQLNVLNRAGDNVRQHLIHDYFARLL